MCSFTNGVNAIILGLLKEYETDPPFSPHTDRNSLLMFIDANYVIKLSPSIKDT